MKKYIPQILKYPLVALYILFKCAFRETPGREITLNLAGVMPEPGQIVHGGKVKLLHLRDRWGDTWKRFNIAYFVSSGLPFAPGLWIKIYKLFGIKIVWNQNGVAYPALYSQDIVKKINGFMRPMRDADYVIYQTEFVKKCADKYLGKFNEPSSVIINPVDTGKFKPGDTSLPENPFIIIMSGSHFESKERMRVSIESVRRLQEKGINAKLIIIGQAEENINEGWIEKTGAFSQDEAPSLYQRAHIFLHLKYLDPCPTLVLEALSCGLPVVGQANGGMPELVDEKSGILLPVVEDFEKLHYPGAEAVAQAIMHIHSKLTEFSANARKRALAFEKEIWLEKHEKIFNKLLDEK